MHFMMFYGVRDPSYIRRVKQLTPNQATLVVVPKFNFVDFLSSIQRHKIGFLPWVPRRIYLASDSSDVTLLGSFPRW